MFMFKYYAACAVLCLVALLCPTLCDPMDCRLPGSSVHGSSPDNNTGIGCCALLKGIFPTHGLNPGLPHCRWILYCLSHQGSPIIQHTFNNRSSRCFQGMHLLLVSKIVAVALLSIRSDQSLSRVRLFATPWIAAHQASLSITNSRNSLRLTSIESVMPSSHLILCRPFLLPPSTFSIQPWPEYWSLSFSIRPSNEYSGPIRMDWLDLLEVQGTLKSLLQHHSSKASILWCSAFFIVQLTNTYMTTGKTIALTRWTLLAK